MTWLDVLALISTALILTSYAVATGLDGDMILFHFANAVFAWPIVAASISHGAWSSVPITAAFGLIGAYGLWRSNASS